MVEGEELLNETNGLTCAAVEELTLPSAVRTIKFPFYNNLWTCVILMAVHWQWGFIIFFFLNQRKPQQGVQTLGKCRKSKPFDKVWVSCWAFSWNFKDIRRSRLAKQGLGGCVGLGWWVLRVTCSDRLLLPPWNAKTGAHFLSSVEVTGLGAFCSSLVMASGKDFSLQLFCAISSVWQLWQDKCFSGTPKMLCHPFAAHWQISGVRGCAGVDCTFWNVSAVFRPDHWMWDKVYDKHGSKFDFLYIVCSSVVKGDTCMAMGGVPSPLSDGVFASKVAV